MMNKLLLDNDTFIEDLVVDRDMDITFNFENISKNITISVMRGVCLKIFDTSIGTSNNITYNIEESCSVIINKLSKNSSDYIVVNLNGENSKINLNSSIINYENNTYKEDINHNVKNCESKIINHCINVENNEFKFIVDGIIKKDAESTSFRQDNKIINLKDGTGSILPNLIVDNSDIDASHSAYIGSFDENAIFYLMSRGLNKNDCHKLLITAFLINSMNLNDKEQEVFNAIIEKI